MINFTSWLWIWSTSTAIIIIWSTSQCIIMYSIQVGYSEWRLFLLYLNLKTQSIKINGRANIEILVKFSGIRNIKVSDLLFAFIRVQFFGRCMEYLCHSNLSCRKFLSLAPWAQNTQDFWIVEQQRKALNFSVLARKKTETNVLVYSSSEGAWEHFVYPS